jgi:hypothetical protein
MQREGDIEITVCDEDCLPYEDSSIDKEDEEWDMEFGRYEKRAKLHFQRKFMYNASFVCTIVFVVSMCYWTYEVMYTYMDYNETSTIE